MGSWRGQGFARARDANEPKIVQALKQSFVVIPIDEPCDLLVQCPHGEWLPLEVKNPNGKSRAKRKNPEGLTEKQLAVRKTLFEPIITVETSREALDIAYAWCGRHPDEDAAA